MRRVLEPGQIEAFAQRAILRIRLPDRATCFARRAKRLRQLSENHAIGHSIADYLHLMAALADAQQAAVASFAAPLPNVVAQICATLLALPGLPANVRDVCSRLRSSQADHLEARAGALLAHRVAEVEPATAPFLWAALQVHWVSLASRFSVDAVAAPDVPGVCPFCGMLPVASVVRIDLGSQGYRYLHCALCATEWHMVRVKCTHCQSTSGITYHSIDGGPEAIRAESCDSCHTYLKILYQEKDADVEPVADDLATLALDLLMGEAGYHRVTGNPLLWQSSSPQEA